MAKPVFKPEFFRELASENPFGLTIHWREAEAWFNYIAWPAYKTYNYTRHHRAVRRWWAGCSMRDLERARDAMDNVKFEAAQVQQDQLDVDTEENGTPHIASVHKIMGGGGDRSE